MKFLILLEKHFDHHWTCSLEDFPKLKQVFGVNAQFKIFKIQDSNAEIITKKSLNTMFEENNIDFRI